MDLLEIMGLGGVAENPEKKRGRPKGAKNKASGDLLKWISSISGGVTPGQQLASLVMVTPRDRRLGKQMAIERGLNHKAFPPEMLGYWYKREQLGKLMGWSSRDADLMMIKCQDLLLPYVHQRQGSIEAEPIDRRATIVVDNTELGTLGNPSQIIEINEEISFEPMPLTHQMSHNG